jgi:Protein of unknown function (DUF4240)
VTSRTAARGAGSCSILAVSAHGIRQPLQMRGDKSGSPLTQHDGPGRTHRNRYSAGVDEVAFWALIEECRKDSNSDTELTARMMFRRLRSLDTTDVRDFVRRWDLVRTRLDSSSVAYASWLMLGDLDDLIPVRDWIISHGRGAVERVLQDSDNLVDLSRDVHNARATWFDDFITEAHIASTSTWPEESDVSGPQDLADEHVDLANASLVEGRFPRLAAFRRGHPELGSPEFR